MSNITPYILQYPSDILYINSEYSKKEEELQKEINSLSETLRNKRKELSKIQKENTLNTLSFCEKNFDLGKIIFNSTTGNIYTVVNNYPLDIEEIKISNGFLED